MLVLILSDPRGSDILYDLSVEVINYWIRILVTRTFKENMAFVIIIMHACFTGNIIIITGLHGLIPVYMSFNVIHVVYSNYNNTFSPLPYFPMHWLKYN